MKRPRRPRRPAKLPVQQLLILSICRIAEPISLTSVFPYLPELIESFHTPPALVAFHAGLTTAAFSLSQCLTGILWGRLSDVHGRKPAILLGLTCTMLTSLAFGFSSSLGMAITIRAIAGLGNGNMGIMRTTVAEMVPQRELQPRAFSVMPLVWTVGSVFGPALGGFLVHPVESHPGWVPGFLRGFLRRWPFAAPNLVAGGFFLETLETKKDRRDYGLELGEKLVRFFKRTPPPPPTHRKKHPDDTESSPLLPNKHSLSTVANHTHEPPTRPTWTEVFLPQSVLNLVIYTLLAMHNVAFDQLLPNFMHLPPQPRPAPPGAPPYHPPFRFGGGFGWQSQRIGVFFTAYAVVGMAVQFLLFPPLARRWGVLNCLKVCAVGFPLIYVVTPFTALLPAGSSAQSAAIFAVMVAKCFCVIFAFPCSTILLTNSAASLRILGTLNGVATSVSAVGRAAGPALGGYLFAVGVRTGVGVLPWWAVAVVAVGGGVPVWWLVEGDGFGRDEGDSESGSEDEEEEGEDGPSGDTTPDADDEDDDDDDDENGYGATTTTDSRPLAPRPILLLDNTIPPKHRSPSTSTTTDNDHAIFEDDSDVPPNPTLLRVPSPHSHSTSRSRSRRGSHGHRRLSSPIGSRGVLPVGPHGARRESTGVAMSGCGVLS